MSRHLTDLQLLLVLAEMCGLFAVCALPALLETELSRAIDSGAISTTFGWARCPSEDGTASNLWRRDALVLGGDLDRFCSDVCGMRYGNRFMAVSQLVPLGAASPFEVEAYLLLALPRSLGGEGFCGIELNVEVMLNTSARAIVGKSRVYIDLLLSSPDGRRQVAIECQGKASHGRAGDGLRDADRMTALQAMGASGFSFGALLGGAVAAPSPAPAEPAAEESAETDLPDVPAPELTTEPLEPDQEPTADAAT